MGDYATFSFTFICGLTFSISFHGAQGISGCCTSNGGICHIYNTTCECLSGPLPVNCFISPGDGEICMDCCYPSYLQCTNNISGAHYCISFPPDICRNRFFTFAQVVLVCALAVAFSALGAICWRICRGRHATTVSSLLRDRESSLTSVQRFIIQRLQDRPPRYEDSNQIHLEKPPPYQEAVADTAPRSLSLPFFPTTLPSAQSPLPQGISSTVNCSEPIRNESCLPLENPSKIEEGNSINAVHCVATEGNPMQQEATQPEAASDPAVQAISDELSLEQSNNVSEPLESAEMKSAKQVNIPFSSESANGVDNLAFSAEEDIPDERHTSDHNSYK